MIDLFSTIILACCCVFLLFLLACVAFVTFAVNKNLDLKKYMRNGFSKKKSSERKDIDFEDATYREK